MISIDTLVPLLVFGAVILLVLTTRHASSLDPTEVIPLGGPAPAPTMGCTTSTPPASVTAPAGVPAEHITYVPVTNDPRDFVTKFGGQPVWVDKPEWPLSRSTGKPMTFVGQIRLDRTQFPAAKGKMAYLFVAGDDGFARGAEPWDPDAGDNAVIVQPGDPPIVATTGSSTGPTTTTGEKDPVTGAYSVKPVAYRAVLTRVVEPAFIDDASVSRLSLKDFNAYEKAIGPDKVGGTPDFFQGSQFPCSANQLLYQVGYQPFDLNLGDGGAGFAFINDAGTAGRFVTQSH
jgi:Domain of unknown function (DUF1963)